MEIKLSLIANEVYNKVNGAFEKSCNATRKAHDFVDRQAHKISKQHADFIMHAFRTAPFFISPDLTIIPEALVTVALWLRPQLIEENSHQLILKSVTISSLAKSAAIFNLNGNNLLFPTLVALASMYASSSTPKMKKVEEQKPANQETTEISEETTEISGIDLDPTTQESPAMELSQDGEPEPISKPDSPLSEQIPAEPEQ